MEDSGPAGKNLNFNRCNRLMPVTFSQIASKVSSKSFFRKPF